MDRIHRSYGKSGVGVVNTYGSLLLSFITMVVLMSFSPLTGHSSAKTTVVHFVANHGAPFVDYLQERAEIFNELHSDIEIVIEVSAGNYTEAVYTRVLSGVPINVLDSTHSFMVFSAMNLLADLRPYIDKEVFNIEDVILPYALDVLGHDGSILGIPSQVHHITTMYNQTMFEEAGLPSLNELGDDWSWDWLQNEGYKLSRDTSGDGIINQYATRFTRSFIHIDPFVHQAGGMLYDRYLNPTESRLNTQAVHDGLEFLLNMYESGIADFSVGIAAMYNSRAAAINLSGAIAQHFIQAETSADRFGVTSQPRGPVNRGGHTYFGPYHVLNSSGQDVIDASYQWIRFLALNEESQLAMMEATGRIPAYVPVLRDLPSYLDSYSDEDRDFIWNYARAAMEPYNFPHYLTSAETSIQAIFNPGFADVFAGRQSLSNFLIRVHDQVQVELNRAQ